MQGIISISLFVRIIPSRVAAPGTLCILIRKRQGSARLRRKNQAIIFDIGTRADEHLYRWWMRKEKLRSGEIKPMFLALAMHNIFSFERCGREQEALRKTATTNWHTAACLMKAFLGTFFELTRPYEILRGIGDLLSDDQDDFLVRQSDCSSASRLQSTVHFAQNKASRARAPGHAQVEISMLFRTAAHVRLDRRSTCTAPFDRLASRVSAASCFGWCYLLRQRGQPIQPYSVEPPRRWCMPGKQNTQEQQPIPSARQRR
jgi:hypothetical protein